MESGLESKCVCVSCLDISAKFVLFEERGAINQEVMGMCIVK